MQKASVGDMLKNAECASIIQVVGAGVGRSFDLEQVRYGKVIIMTAVSYTHLDVYKRQPVQCPRLPSRHGRCLPTPGGSETGHASPLSLIHI